MTELHALGALRANSAAMNAREPDRYAATFTEDVVWESDIFPAPVVGREAVAQTMGGFWAAFPDLRFEVERDFASGEQGAVCWRVTGTHRGDFAGIPPTGRHVEYTACAIMRLRDGKIAHVWTYLDTATILRQLGALPGGESAHDPQPAGE